MDAIFIATIVVLYAVTYWLAGAVERLRGGE